MPRRERDLLILQVRLVPLGGIDAGVWCPDCALPSCFAQHVLATYPCGHTVLRRVRMCADCHTQELVEAPTDG